MIYYFSATGNSKWVADKLAEGTDDQARSITAMMHAKETPVPVGEGETLGIVFPIYAWSFPRFVGDFIKQMKIDPRAYVYVVCTCGDDAGHVVARLKKHIHVDAAWSIKMPNDYVILSDLDSEEMERRKIEEAKRKVPEICTAIKAKRQVTDIHMGKRALLKTYLINPWFIRFYTKDEKFHAEESCDGCGICERVCPMQNIRLTDGKPVWQGNCMHCCACINRCPTVAINYGSVTQGRRRYYLKTIRK